MKLVRYGNPGKEKPGLLDAEGRVRDLSEQIDDITAEQLSDSALGRLAALEIDSLPRVSGTPGWVYRWQAQENTSVSALITLITHPKQRSPSRPSPLFS